MVQSQGLCVRQVCLCRPPASGRGRAALGCGSARRVTGMKAVILAGGHGTRLAEETDVKPKPMVEIGGRPILWHIMQIYSCYGVREFIICLGYKGYLIDRKS